jgi:hypothetical protein
MSEFLLVLTAMGLIDLLKGIFTAFGAIAIFFFFVKRS